MNIIECFYNSELNYSNVKEWVLSKPNNLGKFTLFILRVKVNYCYQNKIKHA